MNLNTLYYLNVFLGSGAIVLQILSVVALFLLFFIPKEKNRNFYLDFIDKHFLVLSFLISLFASVFPLVYSEVANFLPCYLCWWQRIFLYPQIFIFAIAAWKKDSAAALYSIALSTVVMRCHCFLSVSCCLFIRTFSITSDKIQIYLVMLRVYLVTKN